MFDGAAPAFHRVLDALQRNQRVDAAQGSQRHRRVMRLGSIGLAKRECAAWRPSRRGGRRRQMPYGSVPKRA